MSIAMALLAGFRRKRRVLPVAALALFVWALFLLGRSDGPRGLLQMFQGTSESSYDVLEYVNPLIGTTNGGHVFPGATLPYGMAKAVADVENGAENAAGFVSDDSKIIGFSHLHDSGTGGSPSLGNFPLFAHAGCPEDDYRQCNFSRPTRALPRAANSTTARAGYFSIELSDSILYEMTTSMHTALYRISFPPGKSVRVGDDMVPSSPLVLFDLTDLGGGRRNGNMQVDGATGRIMGSGTFLPSFGTGSYQAHFCADFRGAKLRRTGTFQGNEANETARAADGGGGGGGGSTGAFVQFEGARRRNKLMVRVGLSFVSAAQACGNGEAEMADFDFEATVRASEQAWRGKLQGAVAVDASGVDAGRLTTFWSGLYRTFLSPQDYTGENTLWRSDEPYFDSFYCIWDSFRAQHPLLTLLDPAAQTRMVRSLLDTYRHEGKLPDCRMSFSPGFTQGGSNADVVLADAYVKGLAGGIDWRLAYEAVVSDAEDEPAVWTTAGRGNLESWKTFGFIPVDDVDRNGTGMGARTVSRTMEYAYDDFAVSQLARGLGHGAEAAKYRERSHNWKNLYDPDGEDRYVDDTGAARGGRFRGFVQPRLRNGTFAHQPARLCSPGYEMHACYLDTRHDTYEGSPWLYTFYVPHDMAALISLLGGRQPFVERLQYFHAAGIIYMGNEQSFLPTYQFHYGGRPALSTYWLHRYIPSQFNSSINGIPGNDDCAMGAFTGFAFMGFFPVAGQDVYLLTAPMFREVRLRTPSGRPAVIRNLNFDPAYRAVYIQSARLNGQPYTRNWITHDFFRNGGLLEFVLGKKESTWGTRDQDLPPSLSTA